MGTLDTCVKYHIITQLYLFKTTIHFSLSLPLHSLPLLSCALPHVERLEPWTNFDG